MLERCFGTVSQQIREADQNSFYLFNPFRLILKLALSAMEFENFLSDLIEIDAMSRGICYLKCKVVGLLYGI